LIFEDTMNMKKMHLLFGFALMLAVTLPLRAQSGCVDSPEDPTIVLALVAGAGAFAASVWRSRSRKQ
jgi:XrtJ-associated TM-motif-TM protein